MRLRIWDAPTRLFHWSLAILIAAAWWTAEEHLLEWHERIGMAILCLLVFRVVWGFIGSSTARFSSFLYGPAAAVRYGLDFLLRRPRRFLGHNPLGGFAAFLMLGLVAAQGVLGLYSYDDHDSIDDETGLTEQFGDQRTAVVLLAVGGAIVDDDHECPPHQLPWLFHACNRICAGSQRRSHSQ